MNTEPKLSECCGAKVEVPEMRYSRKWNRRGTMDKQDAKQSLIMLLEGAERLLVRFKPPADEGLREKIAEILDDNFDTRCLTQNDKGEFVGFDLTGKVTDLLLALFQQAIERDYVKLDKDQTLPIVTMDRHIWSDYSPDMAFDHAVRLMRDAGWRKIR